MLHVKNDHACIVIEKWLGIWSHACTQHIWFVNLRKTQQSVPVASLHKSAIHVKLALEKHASRRL